LSVAILKCEIIVSSDMPYPSRTVIPIVSKPPLNGASCPEIIYFASATLISVVVFLDDTIYDRYS
jgi:hypothetical protein